MIRFIECKTKATKIMAMAMAAPENIHTPKSRIHSIECSISQRM